MTDWLAEHPMIARSSFRAAKELYQAGVFNDDELYRAFTRCFRTMSKKANKAARRETKDWILMCKLTRDFLHDELAKLDLVTVNDRSTDLLKVGAPDTYDVIKTHLLRRLDRIKT